ERERESRGLAGAGLGASQDVATLQHQRNGLRLDRRRLDVPLLRNRFQQLGQQVQFSKTRQTNTLLPPWVRAEETSFGGGKSADEVDDDPDDYSKVNSAVRISQSCEALAPRRRARAPAPTDPALANAAPQARARSWEHCRVPRRDCATSARSRSSGLRCRTCAVEIRFRSTRKGQQALRCPDRYAPGNPAPARAARSGSTGKRAGNRRSRRPGCRRVVAVRPEC